MGAVARSTLPFGMTLIVTLALKGDGGHISLFRYRDLSRTLLITIMLPEVAMATAPAQKTAATAPGLKRSLSIWQAVGLSLALMAPSMAANINPQGAIGAGRAVPLAFLIAAVGVLFVAYTFARLCQYYRHSGSVYAFVGATLGPRAGVVAGWGLAGTYVFYAVTTAAAAGIFGTGLLDSLGLWKNQPSWAPMLFVGVVLALALLLAALPARGGTNVLLIVEVCTVTLILIVTVVVFVKLLSHSAPGGSTFTWSVFSLAPGTGVSALFLGVVFGFLSFAGFEASSTLGEEAHNPSRDIPRAILGVAVFGGIYYVVVTAAEMMGFGTSAAGIKAFGSSRVAAWRPRVVLRRLLGRQHHHRRDDRVRVRLLPGLHGRRGADDLRDVAGLLRRARDRGGPLPVGHAGRRHRRGHRHGRDHLRRVRDRFFFAVRSG